jgi:hypothetical protein
MYKWFSTFFLSLSILLLFSCSKTTQLSSAPTASQPLLKDEFNEIIISNDWVDSSSLPLIDTVEKTKTTISFPLFFIYPYLEDFANLDTSLIPEEINTSITKIMKKMLTDEIDASLFSSASPWVYPLLKQEMKNLGLLKQYLVGMPHITNDVFLQYEIPIRLFLEKEYVDIWMFYIEKDEKYVLDQINFGDVVHE